MNAVRTLRVHQARSAGISAAVSVPFALRAALRRMLRYPARFVAVVAAAAAFAPPYVDALAFIARAAAMAGIGGTDRRVARAGVRRRSDPPDSNAPRRDRRAHVSSRAGPPRRAVTLVPGVHMDGIRESRLVGMAEDLAASGYAVLTVATPDLQRFRITPASTDIIEDAAEVARRQEARRRRRQDRDARHQLFRRPVDRRRRTRRSCATRSRS